MFNQDKLINFFLKFGFTSLALTGIIFLQNTQLETLRAEATVSKENFKEEANKEKVSINMLKQAPTLGFNNLIADWSFIKFVMYYGDTEARKETDYSLVPDYFKIVVDRDPRFIDSYLYFSLANSVYAGRPDITVALMNKGLQSLSPKISSKSPYVWLYKGTDELLFLGDNQAAKNSFKTAATWAKVQHTEEGDAIAFRASETAQFLETNPDSKRARISAWSMILANSRDKQSQQLALKQIELLGGQVAFTSSGVHVKVPEDS
jgi:hypothetical protein